MNRTMLSERSLIEDILAPLTKNGSGALGLTDDAAFIRPAPGHDLVITQDSLQAGVHFFDGDPLDLVAKKALRVNLSDLFAKGAQPQHYLLSLFIPPAMGEAELKTFASGLKEDQTAYGIELLGGDTVRTPGAFGLTVTMSGEVPQGQMIRRSGAAPGDLVYVSGTIGDAALGLKILNREISVGADKDREYLVSRYRLPQPPVSAGEVLRAYASAAMDISDGLAGDLYLLTQASGVTARIEGSSVPLSGPAGAAVKQQPELLGAVLAGGDDYQILCTVPENKAGEFERASDGTFTKIGLIGAGAGAPVFTGYDGQTVRLENLSYTHF